MALATALARALVMGSCGYQDREVRWRDDESALSADIISSEVLRSEGETRTLGDGLRELDEADSTQPSVAALIRARCDVLWLDVADIHAD